MEGWTVVLTTHQLGLGDRAMMPQARHRDTQLLPRGHFLDLRTNHTNSVMWICIFSGRQTLVFMGLCVAGIICNSH